MSEKIMSRRQALIATTGMIAAAATVAASPAQAEFQPAMEAALAALHDARAKLMLATTDKGGHRIFAVSHIDKAITQVNLGIHWDNTH
jgi:hypothetical protein